jgi:hypothetical protein
MTKEEKLEKVCLDFGLLSEEKQEYVLGMLQALVFIKDEFKPVIELAQNIQEEKQEMR